MRIPPGLFPKPVTSTREAADAGAGTTAVVTASSRALAMVTNAVLNPLIGDLRSAIPLATEVRQIDDDRQQFINHFEEAKVSNSAMAEKCRTNQ
jgi:hypothetical protein